MPQRIQLRRAKGWRLPPNTVVVSRPTKWGNPFVVGKDGTREECIKLYVGLVAGFLCVSKSREHIDQQERAHREMQNARSELAGKDLACWCRPDQACHADVLLAIANGRRIPKRWLPKFTRLG